MMMWGLGLGVGVLAVGGKGNTAFGFLRDLIILVFGLHLQICHDGAWHIGTRASSKLVSKSRSISDGNISVKKENIGQSQMKSHLTLKNSCSSQTEQVINDALLKMEDGVKRTKLFKK